MITINVEEASPDSLYVPFVDQFTNKVFKNRIRLSIIESTKTLGGNVDLLFEIENGKILAEHIAKEYQRLHFKEKNLAFLWSCFVKRADLLQPLFEINANIHSTVPSKGYTGLHLAAFNGCFTSCKSLILNGLDLSLVVERVSPLDCAIVGNSIDCTKLLLQHGATLGNTALHRAIRVNATNGLKYLLSKDININAVDENGYTALHVAANSSKKRCLQTIMLHPKVGLNIQTRLTKSSPLHLAAKNSNSECCQLLIDGGADANVVDIKGQTALHLVAKAQSTECVKILLDAGCAVNSKDVDGRTALHLACLVESKLAFGALEALLKRDAEVNVSDKHGYTPLHFAALNDMSQCVDWLIMSGADVTARTHDGFTALSIVGQNTPGSVKTICRKLDSSISMSEFEALSKEVELKFDFQYFFQNSSEGEMGFLKTLKAEGHKHLIEHPLCEAFLHVKWRRIRKLYFYRLFLCFVFVILFTGYVIYALAHECYNAAKSISAEACQTCLNSVTLVNSAARNISTEACEVCLYNFISLNDAVTNVSAEACQVCWKNVTNTAKNVSTEVCTMCFNDLTIISNTLRNASTEAREMCLNNSAIGSFLIERPRFIEFIWYVLVIIAILESIRKLMSIPGHRSVKHYFNRLKSALEWFVILSVFLVSCSWYGRTSDWQKNIGGVAVLLAWADLMVIIGPLPIFGDYVAMFTRVQTEFFKVLLAYSCLLIGFTASFCVVFPYDNTFQNPLIGFIKMLAMMTGESDFGILKQNLHPETFSLISINAHITYALYLLFITVVLMNLLVGIAVNDIQGLHKTAGLSKLVRQIELIYYFELAVCSGYVPERMVQLLPQLALKPAQSPTSPRAKYPRAYRTVLCVKPFHPSEKRLRKEVMLAAFNLAKQKKAWTNSACCWSDTPRNSAESISHQDEKISNEEFRQLKEMVQAQNALISQLVNNNRSK